MRLDYEKISINQNIAIVVAKFYLIILSKKGLRLLAAGLIVYKKTDLENGLLTLILIKRPHMRTNYSVHFLYIFYEVIKQKEGRCKYKI